MARPLFQITEDFKTLDSMLDRLDESDAPEDERASIEAELMQWLQGLNDEQREKIDSYCWVIKNLTTEAETAAEVAKEFYAKAKARENRAALLKQKLLEHMIATEQPAMAGKVWNVKVTPNGGLQPLKIFEELLPEEYFYTPDPKPDTDKIRAALNAEVEIKGAELGERGKHLRIR